MDWSSVKAPGLGDIERLAGEAFARLPVTFVAQCEGLVIRVEDVPDEDVIMELGLDGPFDLLGLYHGTSLADKSTFDPPALPDMVFLYRRPLLDFWAEGEESLGDIVTHVLVHEIGHHFGLSDEEMERLEREAGVWAPRV